MSRRAFRTVVLALPVVAALVSGCGTTPTEPTVTAPPSATAGLVPVTEAFSGALASGGANVYTFHTMQGLVKVTLNSLDPADAPFIGMGVGMWDGLSCQLVYQSPYTTTGTELLSTASIETRVCIKVWDLGTLDPNAALTYTLSAVHNEKPSS
jgi:hypothetical protein